MQSLASPFSGAYTKYFKYTIFHLTPHKDHVAYIKPRSSPVCIILNNRSKRFASHHIAYRKMRCVGDRGYLTTTAPFTRWWRMEAIEKQRDSSRHLGTIGSPHKNVIHGGMTLKREAKD